MTFGIAEWSMISPHPQPFSVGRREPELLFPLPGATVYTHLTFISGSIKAPWGEG